MSEPTENEIDRRARTKEIAEQHLVRGDALGWFDELYKEAAGDNEKIPWADLEPNRYFRAWAEKTGLSGRDRTALVVGCGLGDDARFLDDLGFRVTAFDISPTAIEWAKRLHADRDVHFEVMDLFEPFREWLGNFEFVLEVYTIQPLPLEMRERTIDSIAALVAPYGELVVITRGREDDEEPKELPWPMSRAELGRFETHGLDELSFDVMPGDDETPEQRFIVAYRRNR